MILELLHSDDIGIASFTTDDQAGLDKHHESVKAVLAALQREHYYVNGEKCTFDAREIEYGGFIVGRTGIQVTDEKRCEVNKLPTPTGIKSVQQFLGLMEFFRQFIPRYTDKVKALQKLLPQGTMWVWGEEQQHAVDETKRSLLSAPVLRPFDPLIPAVVYTDGSDYGIGAFVGQRDAETGLLHPVEFWSRKIRPAEHHYKTGDKELLAIVEPLKHWRHWLSDTDWKVVVCSDHQNLKAFTTQQKLSPRQMRWGEALSEFNMVIYHVPGSKNKAADALSRDPDYVLSAGEKATRLEHILLPVETFLPRPGCNPQTFEELTGAPEPGDLRRSGGIPGHGSPPISTDEGPPLERAQARTCSLVPPISPDTNPVVPPTPAEDTPTSFPWNPDAIPFLPNTYRKPETIAVLGRRFLVESPQERLELLRARHDAKTAGHLGIEKTLELIQRDGYYWQNMRRDVEDYVKSCDSCQRVKADKHRPFGPLQPLPIPERPWTHVGIDFVTHLPKSKDDLGNTFTAVMTVVCRRTGGVHFVECNEDVTAESAARLYFRHVYRIRGLPLDIVSDRGPQFISRFWKTFWQLLGASVSLTTAFHPEADGKTERANQKVVVYLRHFTNYEQDNWVQLLPFAEFTYNNSVQDSIGMSPFYATQGFHPVADAYSKVQLESPSSDAEALAAHFAQTSARLTAHLSKAQEIMKKQEDKHRVAAPFKAGDKVWLLTRNLKSLRPSGKLDYRKVGPFVISDQLGPVTFRLNLPPDMHVHNVFHASLLSPHHENRFPGRQEEPAPAVQYEGQVEQEWEVEEILGVRKRGRRWEWLVDWKGYGIGDRSWEPFDNLGNAAAKLRSFYGKPENVNKPYPAKMKALLRGVSD